MQMNYQTKNKKQKTKAIIKISVAELIVNYKLKVIQVKRFFVSVINLHFKLNELKRI